MEDKVDVLNFLPQSNLIFDAENLQDFFAEEDGDDNDKTICFTGNRPAYLPWKYNESCSVCYEFKRKLYNLIERLYQRGYKHFISGMALGFDTIAAETVLAFKKEHSEVTLECAIPFAMQSNSWAESQKQRYIDIINRADRVVYVSQNYDAGCYRRRNEYMVNCSDTVVAYSSKGDGGTFATISYAMKLRKRVILIR